jgi:hypothetical protein
LRSIAALPGRNHQTQQAAATINGRMQFGCQSAATSSQTAALVGRCFFSAD